MRTSSRHPRAEWLAALALLLVLARVAPASEGTTTAPGAAASSPRLRTLDLSSLGRTAPTDTRPGTAPALSVPPYG